MKTALLAFSAAMLVSSAALADYASMKDSYVDGAFSGADDNWRRIVVNKNDSCGEFGSNDQRRVDVLISRYEAIGEALASGDESGATSAGQSLSDTLDSSVRFEKCWDVIAQKNGIKRSFKRTLASN